MNGKTRERKRRLFFGLPIDEATRSAIDKAVRGPIRGRGRRVPPDNLHMTLAFLGGIEPQRLPEIEALAAGVAAEPFRMDLGRLGYWARPRVIWLAPLEVPPALLELVAELQARLGENGLPREERPFAPHVTLVRKAGGPPAAEAIAPIPWAVDRFCLFESVSDDTGVRYVPLACWPLDGSGES